MKPKIVLPFLFCFTILLSCKNEIVKTPKNLIEKDKMVAIMYDLSLLTAIKIQTSSSIDSTVINSNEYIYKKYHIDSIQFVQSNIYYATDTKEYKKMIEQVKVRLETPKSIVDKLVKAQAKKDSIKNSKIEKLRLQKVKDSINRQKKADNKGLDSVKK